MKINATRWRQRRLFSAVGLRRIPAALGLMLAAALIPVRSAHAAEVTVYAASSLGKVFQAMARQYQRIKPDVRITFSFAASDVLQRQVVHGAPADIFAAADQVAMDKAERAGAIQPSTRRDFATNTLVLIKPADAEGDNHAQGIAQLADLDSQAVTRIGLGNPATVPAGRYARDSLREANLWDALQEKQVLAQNVRQVLDYVARGEVDAGFVFATDAALMPDRVKVVENVASPTSIRYPLALVQRKERPDAAADFYDFILSQPGQQILSDHGFGLP